MNMHAAFDPAGDAPASRIANVAMLASVRITQWSARKLDKRVTDEVNRDHGASHDAGRYNKALLSRDALADIVAAANKARSVHYSHTLPWHDSGARILSAANYLKFTAAMREVRAEFETAVQAFVANYADYREAARARLNGMFSAEDYPGANEIAGRFSFAVDIDPMPQATDFRVSIGDDEAELIRQDIERRQGDAIQSAVRDAYARIVEHVGKMAETLAADRQNAKGETVAAIFRDSLVENVRELADLLPGLNITGDSVLATMADKIKADLCGLDADALRDDATARKQTAAKAAAIARAVSDYLA